MHWMAGNTSWFIQIPISPDSSYLSCQSTADFQQIVGNNFIAKRSSRQFNLAKEMLTNGAREEKILWRSISFILPKPINAKEFDLHLISETSDLRSWRRIFATTTPLNTATEDRQYVHGFYIQPYQCQISRFIFPSDERIYLLTQLPHDSNYSNLVHILGLFCNNHAE